MVADLREMQENQGFSENLIDKFEFVKQFGLILSYNSKEDKNRHGSKNCCACKLFYGHLALSGLLWCLLEAFYILVFRPSGRGFSELAGACL